MRNPETSGLIPTLNLLKKAFAPKYVFAWSLYDGTWAISRGGTVIIAGWIERGQLAWSYLGDGFCSVFDRLSDPGPNAPLTQQLIDDNPWVRLLSGQPSPEELEIVLTAAGVV